MHVNVQYRKYSLLEMILYKIDRLEKELPLTVNKNVPMHLLQSGRRVMRLYNTVSFSKFLGNLSFSQSWPNSEKPE